MPKKYPFISSPESVAKRLDTQFTHGDYSMSKVNEYWLSERFRELYKSVRPGLLQNVPANYHMFDQNYVLNYWKLKGLEYGNWLSQEDKYNYFMSCQMAMIDLDKILNFNHNIGLDHKIGFAFGARGSGGALAHFESHSFMINITRFKEAKKVTDFLGRPVYGDSTTEEVKDKLFLETGGMGSFGHEYGHALDYFFGTYFDQSKYLQTLTLGRSIKSKFDNNYKPSSLRYDALNIIKALIYKKDGSYTSYYALLKKGHDNKKISSYWLQQNELFARAFEVYLSIKLGERKITNRLLVKNKYEESWPYPDRRLMKASVVPHFDSLIKKMSTIVKSK